MKRVLILIVLLAMAQGALAEEKTGDKSVAQKTGEAVKKGGAAAGRGIEKGAKATVKGLKKAGEWVGKKAQQGGEKLEKASK